jgi:RNA polymerase sigma factor FliA
MLDGTGMLAANEDDAIPASSPWQGLAWRQTRGRLSAAVAELPDQYRRIIQYHYFNGLRFDQIAGILGLSRARISQLHQAALARLKETLGARQRLYMEG